MRTAISRFLWLVVVVVLVGVCAGAAIAEVAVSSQCTFVDQKGNPSPYTMKIWPDADGSWPVWNGTSSKWEWRYQLETSSGKYTYSLVDFMLPACSSNISFADADNIPLAPVGPPGTGDPSYDFGWWDGTKYTYRLTPNTSSSPQLYSLLTAEILPAQNTYIGMKIGSGTFSCKSIAGPGCPECPGLPFQPATITQCMEVENHHIMLVRNTNRCITDVYDCGLADAVGANSFCKDYATSCTHLTPNVTVEVVATGAGGRDQAGITVGDILGNQICPEGILFSASSPGCSNVRTLSGWIQVCR